MSILVIEDNPTNLELVLYLLQAYGYAVRAARDGEEGLELALERPPALVLCDLQLPGMDGYQVARRFLADPRLREVPLLALTALAMVGDRERALAAGFDGYISKPIDPPALVEEVARRIGPGSVAVAPVVPTAGSRPGPELSRERVLVVDDRETNRILMRDTLQALGYPVELATGLRDGLRKVREWQPRVIVCDLCLGDGSGFELLETVAGSAAVLILSARSSDPADRQRALSLGAAAFLTRPIEPVRLAAEIEKSLKEE